MLDEQPFACLRPEFLKLSRFLHGASEKPKNVLVVLERAVVSVLDLRNLEILFGERNENSLARPSHASCPRPRPRFLSLLRREQRTNDSTYLVKREGVRGEAAAGDQSAQVL